MHNHDNHDNRMKSMMWMMVICCAVLLLLIFVLGAGGKSLGFPIWVILGGILVMAGAHFFTMGRSHKHSGEKNEITNMKNDKSKGTHSGHECCR